MIAVQNLLADLLVVEVAALGVMGVLYLGGLRRYSIERRVRAHLAPGTERHSEAHSPVLLAGRNLLVELALLDITEQQRQAIPWLGKQFRLGPGISLQVVAIGRLLFAALGFVSAYVLCDVLLAKWLGDTFAFAFVTLAAVALNWWVSKRYIAGILQARQEMVSSGMPYALDLILICLDSGAALETAISRVAAELAVRDPLVADELTRTLLDIRIIGNREQAFRNLGERIDTPNMRAIVTVLSQSLQYGSSLIDSLKGAIQNMKQVELLMLEESAGKLPVQLTLPGLIFTLPQLMILLAGPGMIGVIDSLQTIN